MSAIPLVRYAHLAPALRVLEERAVPTEPLLRAVGLPLEGIGDPEVFVPSHLVYQFVEAAARIDGLGDLGWVMAERASLAELPGLGVGFRERSGSRSLQQALEASFRAVEEESTRAVCWIQPAGDRAWLCYSGSHGVGAPGFATVEQYMAGVLVQMVRRAAGPGWRADTIRLRDGAPPDREARGLESALRFAARVQTGQGLTAISVHPSLLALPVRSDAASRPEPERFEGPVHSSGLASTLRCALRPYLDSGPAIGVAARIAGTSVRTLQRRLAAEGVTFGRLVDDLRRETAIDLVSDSTLRFVDVARELGYTDPAHFTRAFRRWTGASPSGFRRVRGFAAEHPSSRRPAGRPA